MLKTLKADFHSHTHASDGTLSPSELVHEAAKRGLTHLAISDHDTMAGIPEAERSAETLEITIIPSIELTCNAYGTTVHMLGINLRTPSQELQDFITHTLEQRRNRYQEMLDKLRNVCGLELEEKEVGLDSSSLGRPQLAHLLFEQGYVRHPQEAFNRWLGKGKQAFVPHQALDVQQAITAIRSSQGIPVLAHCGKYKEGLGLAEKLLTQGLMGIEVYHPDHSKSFSQQLLGLCNQHDALISAGADFHGFSHARSNLFGKIYLSNPWLDRLLEAYPS